MKNLKKMLYKIPLRSEISGPTVCGIMLKWRITDEDIDIVMAECDGTKDGYIDKSEVLGTRDRHVPNAHRSARRGRAESVLLYGRVKWCEVPFLGMGPHNERLVFKQTRSGCAVGLCNLRCNSAMVQLTPSSTCAI